MIAAWMVYCIAVGLAICVAARAAERALYLAGQPTRWAWSLALAGSLFLPALAFLQPQRFTSISVPFAAAVSPSHGLATAPADVGGVDTPVSDHGSAWSEVDALLGWGWGFSSTVMLLLFGLAAVRLAVVRRRWRPMVLDGHPVFIAQDVGPAVAGLWQPQIVIPGWALLLSQQQQRLMLAHEAEHVRARDPWLLISGTAALVLAPWNPTLWWLFQHLRLAVETDCDTRVLRCGHSAQDYGALLLRVGGRRAHLPMTVAALGEPRSMLEGRIHRLSSRLPQRRPLRVAAAAGLATAMIVAACETPRPVSPERMVGLTATGTSVAMDSLIRGWMRPWVQENLLRYYPDLMDQRSGPPVDVWFGHNSRLEVLQVARTAGTSDAIGSRQILRVFSNFRPGNDGWGVVDRRALNGLVRDNVRVIWVHLDYPVTKGGGDAAGGTGPYDPDLGYLRLLARRYHPEVFTQPLPHAAIALVFDSQHRVIAHAAGVPEARDDGCLAVAQRLVPAFANAKWSSAGCADGGDPVGRVVVYWILLR